MKYPRVLVIANNCFSLSNSNGRTLSNMLMGWPKDCLAEFCISVSEPNFDLCDNYFCVSDKEILEAFLKFKKAKGREISHDSFGSLEQISTGVEGRKKTCFLSLVRHLLWSFYRWKSNKFVIWYENYSPDIILLQNGDSAFILKIAIYLAKRYNIPLMMFNTEGFYFMTKNYMHKGGLSDYLFYPLYDKLFYRPAEKKAVMMSTTIIHGNSLLKEDYDQEFGVKSECIYTGSTVKPSSKPFDTDSPFFLYAGNLSFDRHEALIEIADVLKEIDSKYKLVIYGPGNNKILDQLNKCENIDYRGIIPYCELMQVIENSDILIHAEAQIQKWQEGLKYGFSTKIADSLSSGKPFLLYSSSNIACARYIKETGAGWHASNRNDLKTAILEILNNKIVREHVVQIELITANKNHQFKVNADKFQKVILDNYKSSVSSRI